MDAKIVWAICLISIFTGALRGSWKITDVREKAEKIDRRPQSERGVQVARKLKRGRQKWIIRSSIKKKALDFHLE